MWEYRDHWSPYQHLQRWPSLSKLDQRRREKTLTKAEGRENRQQPTIISISMYHATEEANYWIILCDSCPWSCVRFLQSFLYQYQLFSLVSCCFHGMRRRVPSPRVGPVRLAYKPYFIFWINEQYFSLIINQPTVFSAITYQPNEQNNGHFCG